MILSVAIVDDDPGIRQMLAESLAAAPGFKCVAQYAEVETAIAGIPDVKPDVVLVDINLGGQSGIECVRALKPKLPATEFIVVTVYDDADRVFAALAAGAAGYLLKRAPREEMLAAIVQAHEGGSPMTPQIARKVVNWFQQRPAAPAANQLSNLTDRESDVLRLLAQGYSYKEIADALAISMGTVNTHVRHTYKKLHVQSRFQAVAALKPPPGAGPAA